MKTGMKRLISLLCVVTVLASTILSIDFFSTKSEAAETADVQWEKLPTNMTEITFSDFGFADGDHKMYATKTYAGETMDNTLFSGKVTFNEIELTGIQYGGKISYGGFNIMSSKNAGTGEWYLRLFDTNADKSGTKFHYDLYPSVAGMQLVGTAIEMHISMEFVNNDGGETKNDLKLGIWFGKKLYNNEYFYVNNYTDTGHSIGNSMTIYTGSTPIKVQSMVLAKLPTHMTEITFSDYGFADGEHKMYATKTYAGETMDNTLFSGKVTFNEVELTGIQYGGKISYGGFNIMSSKNAGTGEWYLRLFDTNADKSGSKFHYDLYPTIAGMPLVGTEVEMQISMEFVNNDGGETKNDLKLGMWFGGRLYNNAYFYVNNYTDTGHSIGNSMTIYTGNTPIKVQSLVNHRLPMDMTNITFSDFGFEDGAHKMYATKTYAGETMDNTLFSGKVTFNEIELTGIQYGGKVAYGGFNIMSTKNAETGEWFLRVFDTNLDKSATVPRFAYNLYSDVAGMQLVGTEIELHISMEFVNNDGGETENDLKLGIWFGQKLYNNTYIYVNNYTDTGHSIGNSMTIYTGGTPIEVKSIATEKLPTTMTNLSFSDFGFADGEHKLYATKTYAGTTMDNTLFSGKVTFNKIELTGIQYGGKVAYGGFNIMSTKNAETGEWFLRVFDTNVDKSSKLPRFSYNLYSSVAGMQLVGTEIEMHISMEFVNNDGGETKNDLKLGIWFGKRLYNEEYIYVNNYTDTGHSIGTSMTIYTGSTPIKVASIKEIVWEELPTGMTEITFRDFGYVDGDVTQYPHKQYEGATMDNTLFSGKITFQKVANLFIQYGGKMAGGGFNLGTAQDSATGTWYLRLFDTRKDGSAAKFAEYKFYSDVALVELVGEELELNITMEYVDRGSDGVKNDVKLGIWFGGKLYNNQYIYLDNFADTGHSVGTVMSFYAPQAIKIESVGEVNWKPMPTEMKEITFRDFGYIDGNIKDYPSGKYEGETLNNTIFKGKITFPEVQNIFLQYGGKKSGAGFNLGTAKDDSTGEWYLRLFDTRADGSAAKFAEYRFYSNVALVELVGEELELYLSMEFVDHDGDGEADDVKLGVWFGGKLYNNNYIYLDNFVNTGHSVGTMMSFYAGTTAVQIKSMGAINWKPMPTGMTEITFRDFGYIDGNVKDYPSGKYEGETLNNTLFGGKITFPESQNIFLQYGGKMAAGGFNLGTAQDSETGEWYLRLFDTRKDGEAAKFAEQRFYSDVALVELVGEELELNISMEYVDHDGDGEADDVKLGVWFAGKLYNNRYIYLDNFVNTGHSVGTVMSFYAPRAIKIESVGTINWKELPTGMTEITFRDFGFIDGTLTQYPNGKYEGTTLDNTMFVGKITFPEKASAHLLYGGKVAGGGIDFVPAQNEETGEWYLRMFDTRKGGVAAQFSERKFYPSVAGMELVGKEIALIITMEYVDHDGDGKANDVKLGVWFGGKLYNNNYIYLDNFVDHTHSMGTWMAFDISGGAKVQIKSVGEIEWKQLPTDFTELHFSDYGFNAGVYEGGSKTGTATEIESMDRTLFSGIITYSTVGETHFTYGGKASLSGLDFVNVYDEETGERYIRLFDTNADKSGKKFNDYRFYADVAGVTLVGEELDLKISMEYVDNDADGSKDDLKLGVWFGGKLYNNRYIFINDYVNTGHSLGNKMTVWNRNGASFGVGRVSEWLDWSAFGLTENWKDTLLNTDFNLEYALAEGNPYTGDNMQYPYALLAFSLVALVFYGHIVVKRRREEYDM